MEKRRFVRGCRRSLFSKLVLTWCLVGLIGLSTAFAAETIVFVQGYLGDSNDWRKSGIIGTLVKAGWIDGGNLQLAPEGVRADKPRRGRGMYCYTVSLPTEAPLWVQASYLERYTRFLRERQNNPALILVGHSAGGVLARVYMVQYPESGVVALVTIASPHLGTESAEIGALIGQSPLGWLASLLGGSILNRSVGLYSELARERPVNFLYWLNRQQHPDSRYVAVIRQDNTPFGVGDLIVPQWSQDMNYVSALRGRVWTIGAAGGHSLRQEDGELLLRILAWLHRA